MTAGSEVFIRSGDLRWVPLGDGLERQILGYDPGMMMVRIRFAAGAVGVLHHHPHRQATYVESGTFQVEIAGEKQTLTAGDAFFIQPHVEHGVLALESGVLIDVFAPARQDFLR